jgi:hypothetical protein
VDAALQRQAYLQVLALDFIYKFARLFYVKLKPPTTLNVTGERLA